MHKAAVLAAVALTLLVGCGSGSSSSSTTTTVATTLESTSTSAPTTTSTLVAPGSDVLIAFPFAAVADAWINVDDSVMGGVSASESSWVDTGGGALLFTGDLSTERNGGFASTLGPYDISIGPRAGGAGALGVHAVGDGRTYLLQLRAGSKSTDRWVARFTPPTTRDGTGSSTVVIPISSFQAVNQFLRPTTPSTPLDPATISQIGIYVLDGQVGTFRLVLERITALR